MPTSPTLTAVAFDFGGPVLHTPFEQTRSLERRLGLDEGHFDWRGPFDPDNDPLWRSLQSREITEREHWTVRVAEVEPYLGVGTVKEVFGYLYDLPSDDIIRPEAERFLEHCQGLGLATAIFTNDLVDFSPAEWIARIGFIHAVDLIVDGSVTGFLKPHPRSYELLVEALDRPPSQILYIDDQPTNIAGGEAAGLTCLWFDVTDPAGSYARAAALLQP